MRLLKIFEKSPLKRLEIKAHSKNSKIKFRASRTSGFNAAIHPLKGLTFNTKHGFRLSKTFKGLTLGFQGGNSLVRGRWSSENGLLNLNLSKSGFSFSSKNKFGTYNITNPNRSSFKIAGFQVRGKKAAGPALFFTLFALTGAFIKYSFTLFIAFAQIATSITVFMINVLIILYRIFLLIYDLLLFVLIDIPKQLFNNFFKVKFFDYIGESEIKIKSEKILAQDRETIKILKQRLQTYDQDYKEIKLFKKITIHFFAFAGLNLVLIGFTFAWLFFTNIKELIVTESFVILLLSILFMSIGRLLIKPLIKMRRHREDDQFKTMLGL